MNDYLVPDWASRPVTLDRLKVSATELVRPAVLQNMKLTTYPEIITDSLAVRLSADVLAEKLPPNVEQASTFVRIEVPESWFQHLKQTLYARSRRLRKLLATRWPVRTQELTRKVTLTVNLQRYHTYPKATIAVPELGDPVRAYTMTNQWSESDTV